MIFSVENELGIKIGDVIRIKGVKRVCGIVSKLNDGESEFGFTMVKGYQPSPKSVLKKKSIFSKVKGRIKNQ